MTPFFVCRYCGERVFWFVSELVSGITPGKKDAYWIAFDPPTNDGSKCHSSKSLLGLHNGTRVHDDDMYDDLRNLIEETK